MSAFAQYEDSVSLLLRVGTSICGKSYFIIHSLHISWSEASFRCQAFHIRHSHANFPIKTLIATTHISTLFEAVQLPTEMKKYVARKNGEVCIYRKKRESELEKVGEIESPRICEICYVEYLKRQLNLIPDPYGTPRTSSISFLRNAL